MEPIRLTQFSPGAGCGCKISPRELEEILTQVPASHFDPLLLVGRESKDDAAVYDAGHGKVVISTTDFFTPIVDDPFLFGKIAACNAMSDIYAMGGSPVMAISILGWPLDKLDKGLAAEVLKGASSACEEAGIVLAGGHSIDIPVPVFGLAVTGMASLEHIRTNSSATEGCRLLLTKPLGIGIISTAAKRGIVDPNDLDRSIYYMTQLNKIGAVVGKLPGVKALTDVTGFGLLGHLLEICEGSGLAATIEAEKVPVMEGLGKYIQANAIPGGTFRNWDSYGGKISEITETRKLVLCDPQTSGGLLIAVEESEIPQLIALAGSYGCTLSDIGKLCKQAGNIIIEVQ